MPWGEFRGSEPQRPVPSGKRAGCRRQLDPSARDSGVPVCASVIGVRPFLHGVSGSMETAPAAEGKLPLILMQVSGTSNGVVHLPVISPGTSYCGVPYYSVSSAGNRRARILGVSPDGSGRACGGAAGASHIPTNLRTCKSGPGRPAPAIRSQASSLLDQIRQLDVPVDLFSSAARLPDHQTTRHRSQTSRPSTQTPSTTS